MILLSRWPRRARPCLPHNNRNFFIRDSRTYQEYIIEREGKYLTSVYHSLVSLDRGHDLYNVIHTCGISGHVVVVFEQVHLEAMLRLDCTNSEIPHV